MKTNWTLMVICFWGLISCHSAVTDNGHIPGIKKDTVVRLTKMQDSKTMFVNADTIMRHITFGVFCGECYGHCATMFQYNMGGNANTLLADYTDSYFNFKGEPNCSTPIASIKKFNIADDIIHHIPRELITDTAKWRRFGCPDCTDGCGIYLAIKREKSFSEYRIDYHPESLDPAMKEIKAFVEYIKPQITKLKQP